MSAQERLRDPEATPADVAVLLRARTKDENGNELGDWTEQTRPTYEQVAEQIEIARALLHAETGPVPDACAEGAESAIALLAAMLVEQSYFPEQVAAANLSAYDRLQELYTTARLGVLACVANFSGGGAYDLDTSGDRSSFWPLEWFQRNLEDGRP